MGDTRTPGVTAYVAGSFARLAAFHGASLDRLFRGLPFTILDCDQKDRRIPWDDLAVLMDRILDEIGPSGCEQIGMDAIGGYRLYRQLASLVVDARIIAHIGIERIAPRLYGPVFAEGSCVDLEDGRLRIVCDIRQDLRASLGFQYATLGASRAYPLHLAQPAARVDARITPRRGEFFVTLPPSNTLPARLSRAQQKLFDRLVQEAVGDPSSQTRAPVSVPRSLAHTTSAYEIIHCAADRLTRTTTVEQFAAEAIDILGEHLGLQSISLALIPPSGPARPIASSCGSGDRRIHRGLSLGGNEVGRIEFDEPRFDDAHQRLAILEELIPWLALALGAAIRADELGRRQTALQREAEERLAAERALLEALEVMSAEAFVVTGAGELLAANGTARRSLDSNDPALRERWRGLAEGKSDPDYTAVPLTRAGLVAGRALVTRRQAGRDFESMLDAARAAWRLTSRQKDVLRQVLKGASNKEIGAALGCTEGTVENHMSHMLRRAGADTRTTLVAKFWGVRDEAGHSVRGMRAG